MKINIFIVIPNLKGGGSERVISNIVSYLNRHIFDVTLVLGNKTGKYLKDIPQDVRIIDMKKERVRYAILPIVLLLRKEKPDIVLSTLGHLNLLIAFFNPILPKRTKYVARESNTISIRNKDESYPKLFDFLFKTVYRKFDFIICQAESMKEDLRINYDFPERKMKVINNPINFDKICNLSNISVSVLPKDKINLLIVGRLSYQKRVDHAIHAIKLLSDKYHLTILGEGELQYDLDRLIKILGVEEKVDIIGFVDNPYCYYKQSNFVLSTSRYEGFPNVVLEANACGTPVISYNYVGGISEIIKPGINGDLANNGNIRDLVLKIKYASEDDSYEREIIQKYAKDRFSIDKIVLEYERLFKQILEESLYGS